MNNLRTKFFIAILAFTVGIISVWAAYQFQIFSVLFEQLKSLTESSAPQTETPVEKQRSGKVEVRFTEFLNRPGYFDAYIHLTNDTAQPISYRGYGQNDNCTVAFKQKDKIKEVSLCTCGNGVNWQTLLPGETARYRVSAWALDKIWKENEQQIKMQFGFKVILGEEKQGQRIDYSELSREHFIWSEEVTLSR